MNPDILIPILTLSAIAIGAGLLLSQFSDNDKFDERQLIERGKGANLAMLVAICYLLGLYGGYVLDLLPMEHMAIFAVYGLAATLTVYNGYCIFHDAYLNREQEVGSEVLRNVLCGAVWMGSALLSAKWDRQNAWIDMALGLDFIAASVMLLLRALIICIQDRRTAKEDPDE